MSLPCPSDDATSLVTGASSGIGADLARELARRGHGVTLVARREGRLNALADELRSAHRVRVEVLPADLSDAAARNGLAPAIDERGLRVALLVNNAGFGTTGPVLSADRRREVSMIRTDVEAVADLCALFLPGMVRAGRGAVLNVASTAAFQPLPGQAAYGACKAFVLAYSQAIRGELRGTGVTVTTLCPGPVKTEFAEVAGFLGEEMDEGLPEFMWVSSARVARIAIEGLDRGRLVVVPGIANRIAAYLGYLAPREVLLPIMSRRHPALRRKR
jgi:short-subunit dehydrogenase